MSVNLNSNSSAYMVCYTFSLHYISRDYQGNNRVVVAPDGTVEQTNDYYAYGGPWGNTSRNQGFQPFKYNGRSTLCDASRLKKELDLGLVRLWCAPAKGVYIENRKKRVRK